MAATSSTGVFTLYRFFDHEDALLYVGLSVNPGRRMEQHRSKKDWWATVSRIEMEQHPDIVSLREAERAAIKDENPVYNIAMNQKQAPREALEDLSDGLVGRWFHSYAKIVEGEDLTYATLDGNGNLLQWQGQIIKRVSDDSYIAQLYSWWDGFASNEVLVFTQNMAPWRFFRSNQHMLTSRGCEEDFGQNKGGKCGAPCTHVIRDYHGMGSIFRCGDCIRYYGGKIEEIGDEA